MSARPRSVDLLVSRFSTLSQPRPGARRRHAGFTMVELMVALTIGLLVTVGILTLLGAMKRNSTAQTGLAQLQDNERIAMNMIADLVQTAGYYPYGGNPSTLFPTTSTAPIFGTAGQFITGTDGTNDTLTVRYATGTAVFNSDKAIDCTGNTSGTAQTYTNTLSISSGGTLQCTLGAGTPISLVNGVCSMTILYGVQSKPGSTNNSVDAYITATLVNSGGYWGKVLAVKVTLNFANPLANSLTGSPCTSTLPQIQFTRVIAVTNKTGVTT